MIQFNYEKIMQPNTVVHCETEEQANNLLEWADSKGLKWCDGSSYLEYNYFNEYKENTCYDLYNREYEGLKYHEEKYYTILSYEEALLLPPNKNIKIILDNDNILEFTGKYLREKETENWHYYKDTEGKLYHVKKDKMICVIED